jgi:hypothetical protein
MTDFSGSSQELVKKLMQPKRKLFVSRNIQMKAEPNKIGTLRLKAKQIRGTVTDRSRASEIGQ